MAVCLSVSCIAYSLLKPDWWRFDNFNDVALHLSVRRCCKICVKVVGVSFTANKIYIRLQKSNLNLK